MTRDEQGNLIRDMKNPHGLPVDAEGKPWMPDKAEHARRKRRLNLARRTSLIAVEKVEAVRLANMRIQP